MIINLFLASILFWISFITIMKIVGDANEKEDLNTIQLVSVVIFLVIDVFFNIFYGSIIFFQIFNKDQPTLTSRLKNILLSGDFDETWRYSLALFMCKRMISPWDANHCGMGLK